MSTQPTEAGPSHTADYDEGFAAGTKESETKIQTQQKSIKTMIDDMKKDVRAFEVKLEAMSKLYEPTKKVERKVKKVVTRGHVVCDEHGKKVRKPGERQFGTHIGRFGHWL